MMWYAVSGSAGQLKGIVFNLRRVQCYGRRVVTRALGRAPAIPDT